MLLTSSQVSIALSSGIVLLFTTALFLSGYAIQQRTLRDLRAAIKPSPRPEPKIFLPDRFKKSTTELPDGMVIEVDDGSSYRGSQSQKPIKGTKGQQRGVGNSQKGFVVEVKPTLPEEEKGRTAGAKKSNNKKKTTKQDDETQHQEKSNEHIKAEGKKQPQKDDKETSEQQQMKSRPPGPDSVPHPEDEEVLVSRAERRRLIKQELQKLSEGTERGYWQRRLW
ncbi:hypothetical protein V8F20_009699 [Naviculisporaceae sp. PSN 640]